MPDIQLTRDKQYLYFTLADGRCEIRYDLKLCQMQKLRSYKFKEDEWYEVDQAYGYFHDYTVDNLKSTEEKFVTMIADVKKLNSNCKSVSTFIARLNDGLVGEEYIANGIKYECSAYNTYGYRRQKKSIVSKPLSFYDKHMIMLFKRASEKFIVSVRLEERYISNKQLLDKMALAMLHVAATPEQVTQLFESLEYSIDNLRTMIDNYKYDMKALLNYCINYLEPFENIKLRESLSLLTDYYRMGYDIGRELKKYPKYLKSMHDIIMANFNAYKKDYNELLFKEKAKPDLEYKNHKYCMLIPKISKDIIAEGTNLNHCVSSYVDKVIRGETYILFMRMIELEDSSLVTVEFKDNAIVQARGSYNRDLIKEEKEFLEEYCKAKKLTLKVGD
jgi:hypothetical protein